MGTQGKGKIASTRVLMIPLQDITRDHFQAVVVTKVGRN
jgi:hypothetical protein